MNFLNETWEGLREAYVNRSEPEGIRKLAAVYWYTLLFSVTILVVSAIIYGLWLSISILNYSDDATTGAPPNGAASILDREALENTLEGFETRRTNYEFLKKNPPRIADPSQ